MYTRERKRKGEQEGGKSDMLQAEGRGVGSDMLKIHCRHVLWIHQRINKRKRKCQCEWEEIVGFKLQEGQYECLCLGPLCWSYGLERRAVHSPSGRRGPHPRDYLYGLRQTLQRRFPPQQQDRSPCLHSPHHSSPLCCLHTDSRMRWLETQVQFLGPQVQFLGPQWLSPEKAIVPFS